MSYSKQIEIILSQSKDTFTLTNFDTYGQVGLSLRDTDLAQAIHQHDPAFMAASYRRSASALCENLVGDAEEIESILIAEESLWLWEQTPYANDKQHALQTMIRSQYASHSLKSEARLALANLTPKDP